ITRNLDSLAATGLPVYITEMDIDGLSDEIQLKEYQRLFPVFWEHTGVQGITLWGFRIGLWRTAQGAYLIGSEGEERPALVWLKAYIQDNFVPVDSVIVSAESDVTSIDEDNGTLQMIPTVLSDTATIKDVAWSVSDEDLATIDSDGLLTAVDNGSVTVTARAIDGSGKQGTLEIAVSNQIPSGIRIHGSESGFSVFPNPVTEGRIVIEGTENIRQIKVLDLNGQQIGVFNAENEPSVELFLNTAPGIYILQLYDGENTIYKKIIMN
ncbi:MAG: T9SS type A sorting domain-containing protein, partial [Bacteroidales bacterium]